MTSANSKYIMQRFSINDFKVEIPEKFHCIICKNVSIETFIAYCECRFCSKCIKKYLKNGNKYCPGIKNECKDEYLEMDLNVSKDIMGIRSIERISVKCPNQMCGVRCDIRNMSDHLRVCDMNTIKCPYENIGCQESQICKDNVKIHCDNEWSTHSQLMVEAIDNLRNDVNVLRNSVERKDEQIILLNDNYTKKEVMIMELSQQINDQRREINIMKDICGRREYEMEMMREDLMMKEVKITEMNQQIQDQRNYIESILLIHKNKIKEMEETLKKTMKEELDNIMTFDVKEYIKDSKKYLNDLKENQENIKREINFMNMKLSDSRIYDEREFIWRVDNFSKMRADLRERRVIIWRYSLKLALYVRCDGDYLFFDCNILKGEFDDYIKWPMKHKITLSMINQDTMKVHKSREYIYESYIGDKSAFDKPKHEFNEFNIGVLFTTVNDIINSPGLLLNDSLIVYFNIGYN